GPDEQGAGGTGRDGSQALTRPPGILSRVKRCGRAPFADRVPRRTADTATRPHQLGPGGNHSGTSQRGRADRSLGSEGGPGKGTATPCNHRRRAAADSEGPEKVGQ